jgi:hypothetical protein
VAAEPDVGTRPGRGAEQRLATGQIKQLAAVECIDVAVGGQRPDQEVTGHADTFQGYPGAATYLDAHDGQRDRDAESAVDDLVQQGVAGVVVVAGVAGEALFDEQPVDERLQRVHSLGQPVQLAQRGAGVEFRVCTGGDRERTDIELWSGPAPGQ